jgi:hypothetical protein
LRSIPPPVPMAATWWWSRSAASPPRCPHACGWRPGRGVSRRRLLDHHQVPRSPPMRHPRTCCHSHHPTKRSPCGLAQPLDDRSRPGLV